MKLEPAPVKELDPSSTEQLEKVAATGEITGWLRFVWGRRPRVTLLRATGLAVVCLIVFRFFLLPVRVSGISMEPTYHDRSVNFINRLSYRSTEPQRGDVVAIQTTGIHNMYLKRIIALPGETLKIVNGVVFIDGRPLDEPYVKKRSASWEFPPTLMEADQYFVIGDNRGMDQELHLFEAVRERRIVGKPLW